MPVSTPAHWRSAPRSFRRCRHQDGCPTFRRFDVSALQIPFHGARRFAGGGAAPHFGSIAGRSSARKHDPAGSARRRANSLNVSFAGESPGALSCSSQNRLLHRLRYDLDGTDAVDALANEMKALLKQVVEPDAGEIPTGPTK